jgi:DNA-directed RNA polymerase omega subunit
MTTVAATATGGGLRGNQGDECWPGIVSRFQLVLLAGRRSKQLYNGAHPRIPADPLKRRNTSIALEELRRGLVPFASQNRNALQTSSTSIDTDGARTELEQPLILISETPST